MVTRKRWTDEEDLRLMEIAEKGPTTNAALREAFPSRSLSGIINRADRQGVDLVIKNRRRNRPWTPREDTILQEIYAGSGNISAQLRARLPNRSSGSAAGRIQLLRRPHHVEQEQQPTRPAPAPCLLYTSPSPRDS